MDLCLKWKRAAHISVGVASDTENKLEVVIQEERISGIQNRKFNCLFKYSLQKIHTNNMMGVKGNRIIQVLVNTVRNLQILTEFQISIQSHI